MKGCHLSCRMKLAALCVWMLIVVRAAACVFQRLRAFQSQHNEEPESPPADWEQVSVKSEKIVSFYICSSAQDVSCKNEQIGSAAFNGQIYCSVFCTTKLRWKRFKSLFVCFQYPFFCSRLSGCREFAPSSRSTKMERKRVKVPQKVQIVVRAEIFFYICCPLIMKHVIRHMEAVQAYLTILKQFQFLFFVISYQRGSLSWNVKVDVLCSRNSIRQDKVQEKLVPAMGWSCYRYECRLQEQTAL